MKNSIDRNVIKVPQISLLFWILKIVATTLGETGGDMVSMSMNVGYLYSTIIFASIFIILVTIYIFSKSFNAWLYWATIVATTTAGTTMADFVDRSLGIGYLGGSLLLFSLLICSLLTWRHVLGTVSINTVNNPKVEIFYWITITFSQTLGTALGDWVADTAGIGYGGGCVLFGFLLAIVAVFYFFSNISHTILFWSAFVLTRPIGAVIGDLMDKPLNYGGFNISRYTISALLAAFMILCLVVFKQARNNKPE